MVRIPASKARGEARTGLWQALKSDVKARFTVSNGLRSHSGNGGLNRSNVCAWILTIGPPVGERTGG